MKNSLNFSEKESARFNLKIYRGEFDTIELKDINNSIIENNADVSILRLPSNKYAEFIKLDRLGFPFIQTDTLVYYYVNLDKYEIKHIRNKDLIFTPFTKESIPTINLLVDEIFVGYTNHYNSNPYLEKTDILEGYKEWMTSFVASENKKGWLVQKDGEYVGFASCSVESEIAEGVLYGVIPSASGKGIYTDIIRFTQNYYKNKGLSTMKVSTQIQNYTVQNVWMREGFFLKDSFATIHINSLLSHSNFKEKIIDLTISEKDIEMFGDISGDNNPLHFENDYAKKLGFEGRISHGLIPNSLMSKYYGTEFPGNGTLFMSYSYKFYKPLYPKKKYKAIITFPYCDEKRGIYLSVVKIIDENESLCLLSYNSLKNNK